MHWSYENRLLQAISSIDSKACWNTYDDSAILDYESQRKNNQTIPKTKYLIFVYYAIIFCF
jgi:hypothetical protein